MGWTRMVKYSRDEHAHDKMFGGGSLRVLYCACSEWLSRPCSLDWPATHLLAVWPTTTINFRLLYTWRLATNILRRANFTTFPTQCLHAFFKDVQVNSAYASQNTACSTMVANMGVDLHAKVANVTSATKVTTEVASSCRVHWEKPRSSPAMAW